MRILVTAMADWMKELAAHYHSMRKTYPNDPLLIMFDIDGTIIDLRYMMVHLLRAYDRIHGTRYFSRLTVKGIRYHENSLRKLLENIKMPNKEREEVLSWYETRKWMPETILQSHRPYPGVLAVIRWFQMQPNTHVGLNTGRPNSLRKITLQSLNSLAEEYRVTFVSKLLYMNRNDWEFNVPFSKVEGLQYFQEQGHRVFAVIDNEPSNLKAISKADKDKEILLLHACTIFESNRRSIPRTAISGKRYDLSELIQEHDLPPHVQFVWHGINDLHNLRQFLSSNVRWAEVDVRTDPFTKELIVRHDDFYKIPYIEDEELVPLRQVVTTLVAEGRSIKFDMKEGKKLITMIFSLVDELSIPESQLWFNGNIELVEEEGFRRIKERFPEAIIQCPIDFLTPLILGAPRKAKEILDHLTEWGINRFSVNWRIPHKSKVLNQLERWQHDVNVYNVPDLEAFLEAVLLLPRSITSDFNFPKWHYFGRGSGENTVKHHYDVKRKTRTNQGF